MKAHLLLRERYVIDVGRFAEIVVWRVPDAVPGSTHYFKYRLAFVVDGLCVLRFDNEAGKGDHRHVEDSEEPYLFTSPAQLLTDFWTEIDKWRA